MDHGDHGGEMDMDMSMSMWFHFGKSETVLFEFWKTDKTVAFVFSLIIIFLMAFAYEGIKFVRDKLYERGSFRDTSSTDSSNASLIGTVRSRILTPMHFIQTGLHGVQFVLSYFLMLIFMTYNVWLALAVTLGAMTGFFCFGWNRKPAVDSSEHCH